MTATAWSKADMISAFQELAVADSEDSLRAVLARYPTLWDDETDQQLTRAIQAGLRRNRPDVASPLLVVRGFLWQLRQGEIVDSALAAMGGAPLYQADPIAQLIDAPQPSPGQVELCRRALLLVRCETEPDLWAYLHFLLAGRLMLDPAPAQVQEAMAAYRVAGDAWQACGQPEQAARARYELARLLIHFAAGNGQAATLRQAVEILESALTTWTRDTHPREWGDVQAALGLALENSPAGLDAERLERAIGHYEAALSVPLDPDFDPAFELARRHYHLGILYAERYRGDRVTNVERAIELLEEALKVRTREDHPEEWADTQAGLANALQRRLRADAAQNIEQAIQAYRAAFQAWPRERNPARWAMIQRNLAEAYRHRVLGPPEENQETAIACFQEALAVYTPQEHPDPWASVHNSLANLYCNRLKGDRAANIETGIDHYNQALQVYTRAAYPRQWAQTQNNLANAYCEREAGNPVENLHTAIALYRDCLEVRSRQAYPLEWAATHNNLGTAYADLRQWDRAVEHFRQALEVRTVDALPDKALQTARNMGKLHFERGEWRQAIEAYRVAQAGSDRLYQQAFTEAGKHAEIGRVAEVGHPMAYALARAGDLEQAALALERERARLLAEALACDRAMLDRLGDQERKKYEEAVYRIRALEGELRAVELGAQGAAGRPTTARSFVEIAEELKSARRELDQAIGAVRRAAGDADPMAQAEFKDVAEAALVGRPLVYLVATSAGGLALVVQPGSIEAIWLNGLTDQALLERVQRWFQVYAIHQAAVVRREKNSLDSARRAWFAVVEDTTHWLWAAVMGRLVARLHGLGHAQATLVPTGLLAFLPLHAAWRPSDNGSARRYVLDDLAIAYAPSARALTHARRMAAVPGARLFAVENPDGSLPYAAREVAAVKNHFTEPWVVRGEHANRGTALSALSECDVYHFACHGRNDWQFPLKSALGMSGGAPLTVNDVLSMERPIQIQARLAFLSACETGLVGTELPDEVVGWAASFIQAGAAGVVSTLWPVADKSTALLAERFYAGWKGQGMEPLQALVAAQRWLRDAAEGGRWAHPYFWAAFSLNGT
jgi:CHAT domain-containing protein